MRTEKDLFGGAITVQLPSNLIDASNLRQIPDTQEVFLYPDSSISIIIEILERVQVVDSAEAIKFHFNSLAEDNTARSSEVLTIDTVPNTSQDQTLSPIILRGEQAVPKFNRTEADKVRVLMALYRIEDKNVDIVVTFNVPLESVDVDKVIKTEADFQAMASTLHIINYSLFA
ncbi:hypothetical protein AMATHDRAFT_2111 [Amanita thiersii Skay4041]|uniref:Ran guanine nucleotide release factor n=1 Tax=Amanita thiersii Skay4041 TaxID=703135 RepID=A0A2A9NN25_9AGAR|nr:hypothetical protein AMATHDRAFT_2111 [Amanita thiersii Skay4041]